MISLTKAARLKKRLDGIASFQMDSIDKVFTREYLEKVEAGIISDDTQKRMQEEVDKFVFKYAPEWLNALKARAPRMLREHKRSRKGFEARNERRWKEGFEKLEMLIAMSTEMGQAVSFAEGENAKLNNDYRFEAVRNLHIRSVLTAREILCLMRGGYADGALGRWRTLHEISVVGVFLSKQDIHISKRYLLSRTCQAYKAATQYKEHEIKANLESFDEQELAEMKKCRDQIVEGYGTEMMRDWGWASPIINNKNITFAGIEKYLGLDHWRPRYRWASQDTHANHLPQGVMLGAAEAKEEVIIAMSSNSGMTDPAHMTAVSMTNMAAAFLTLRPNIDRIVGMMVMNQLQNEIGETFLKIEKETYERACLKSRWFSS